MPKGLLEIQDEINVRFLGVPRDLIETAQAEVTFYVPGYNFMPAYKNGGWDGRVRLMGVTGKTYLNLVNEVLPVFEAAGYDFEIEDNRHDWSSVIDNINYVDENYFSEYQWDNGDPIILRDYQVNAVNTAIAEGQGLLELATGSGKTICCAVLSKVYAEYGNVVIMVPNIDLVFQTAALFKRVGIDVGMWYGELKEHKRVVISTWQSLDHFPELFANVVCCINDEAHQSKAKTVSELLTGPGSHVPFRFGCTGTVPKEDIWQYQIRGVIGPTIFKLSAWELQKIGVLASAEVYQIVLEDSKNPAYKYAQPFEDWSDQLEWMFSNSERVATVAAILEDTADTEGNVLTLIPYKKHGKALHELIAGSVSVDGDIKGPKRQALYKEFGAGDNGSMIATFGVASTGIDIPRIHAMGFVEPGKKFEKIIQSVGRGLRKADDKSHAIILDICGDSDYSKKHATERRKLYKEARLPCHVETIDYANS